jgi:Tfp pilus assembly protein PilO
VKLSRRELVLAWVTGAVVLIGVTFWMGRAKVQAWGQAREEMGRLRRQARRLQTVVNGRGEWARQLDEIQATLPVHPLGKDVTAELLLMLEQTANQHGLTLKKREPQPERSVGDLYEVSIICTWEGDLDSLTHFLYAIHTKGVILDIRQLSVAPIQGVKGQLKGGFTVDCAYTRVAEEA